jgi:PAS domain S-box-containing protein
MLKFINISILQISPWILHLLYLLCLALIMGFVYYLLYRRVVRKYSKSRLHSALHQKDLLEQLINNMPDFIYYKDRESRFVLANKHTANQLGKKDASFLIGKTDFDFFEEDLAREYYEDEQKVMNEGKPLINKVEIVTDDKGNHYTISSTKIPIRGNNNKVIGLIGIGRDISDQVKKETELKKTSESLQETNVLLEERQEEIQQMAEELNTQAENLREVNASLERLSVVASATENVVIIMDSNGNFEWVNKGFEDKYEISMDEFVKKYGNNLRENSSTDNISAILNQVYITKKPYTYNARYQDDKGHEFWNQTNIFPVLNEKNKIQNLILIDSDISELKKAEIQIKEQKIALEQQAKELDDLNKTKDRLFSIIAHDLKNPFHSILGFTEILQKKYHNIEREKLRDYLEMINTSTTTAYQLLENLLEWARAQTKRLKVSPEEISINQLVSEIIALQKVHAGSKNIVFSDEMIEDSRAYADRNMINTVIRNLTSNAIKYTNEGGSITFSSRLEKDKLIFEISDTGIGIPQERLDAMFQLDKVNSTAGTAGEAGTGLGLIVCHEFIKHNQGTISVSSKPGKGSTFKITLPRSK